MRPEQAFIDWWNSAAGRFGRYNEDTGYFELNGLTDITYAQALLIARYPLRTTYDCRGYLWNTMRDLGRIRTNLLFAEVGTGPVNCQNMFNYCGIEIVRLPGGFTPSNIDGMFVNCGWLWEVLGSINMSAVQGNNFGINTTSCHKLFLYNLKKSFNLYNFYNLELECWRYLIDNATNTSAITITVHPNVFDKMTNTENPLYEEWSTLINAAAQANISFITA